ncbi:MAG: peptide deformylase [Clostridia bacterium]|nr:peptide deformylase [Clostridia bacterium]MDD4376072.1 peptide deformylase [Clostridia bacterium]
MAIRVIRNDTDELLRKKSRNVEEIDNKVRELVLDMLDTMYDKDGVGLAAPQVGILKRIVVYDIGEGPKVLINPIIEKATGKQCGEEGCLSSPNVFGEVDRPEKIVVKAYDIDGKEIKVKATELEAIVICHEIDHLNGVLFLDIARDIYTATNEEIEAAKEKTKNELEHKNGKKKKNNKKIYK